MFEGSFSNEHSSGAIREEHEQRRKDMELEYKLSWQFIAKFFGIFAIIIGILIALD